MHFESCVHRSLERQRHAAARVAKRALRSGLVIAGAVAMFAAPAAAQLPDVAQVYDAYAKAVGGRAVWAKVTDRADKGTANITFANMIGTYERFQSAPNKFHLVIKLEIGQVVQGSDGTVVWSMQPGGGATTMDAGDAAYVLESARTGDAFLDPRQFAAAAVTAKESFDGVECYKVSITTKTQRAREDYFEIATGLKRGQVLQSPQGPQATIYRDYKAFSGKMVPTTLIQSNGQGQILITVTEVTFTPNDPALFVPPPGMGK